MGLIAASVRTLDVTLNGSSLMRSRCESIGIFSRIRAANQLTGNGKKAFCRKLGGAGIRANFCSKAIVEARSSLSRCRPSSAEMWVDRYARAEFRCCFCRALLAAVAHEGGRTALVANEIHMAPGRGGDHRRRTLPAGQATGGLV